MNTYFSNNKRHPETHDTTPRHWLVWGWGGAQVERQCERKKKKIVKSFCGVIYYANGFNAKGNWANSDVDCECGAREKLSSRCACAH